MAFTKTYPTRSFSVANASPDARALFIRRTYAHLAGAISVFAVLVAVLLNSPNIESLIALMVNGQYSWLVVLGLFIGATYLGQNFARSGASLGLQYLGLGIFVGAYALIFLPILYIASNYYEGVIGQAAIMTLLLVAGLTATVFITRKDFSFLGPILAIGFLVALGCIVAGILFGFDLGLGFSAIMVILAAAAILYQTSNILHVYGTNEHVGASLALFGAIATLFFYILRILMRR